MEAVFFLASLQDILRSIKVEREDFSRFSRVNSKPGHEHKAQVYHKLAYMLCERL